MAWEAGCDLLPLDYQTRFKAGIIVHEKNFPRFEIPCSKVLTLKLLDLLSGS